MFDSLIGIAIVWWMKMILAMKHCVVTTFLFCFFLLSLAEAKKSPPVAIDKIKIKDNLYGQSKKTEAGDQVEIDAEFRYDYDEDIQLFFGFETNPEENRIDNSSSKIEAVLKYGHRGLELSHDVNISFSNSVSHSNSNSNAHSTSNWGQSTSFLSIDLDSEKNYIAYSITPSFKTTLFPFNFNGEVGREFNTWDVTRIYFIEGAPPTVAQFQLNKEFIGTKTIPGLELRWMPDEGFLKGLHTYASFGLATYLYPTNENFDIQDNPTAHRWERREDFGYKVGLSYKTRDWKTDFDYVAHTKSQETGSLLASGASLYLLTRLSLGQPLSGLLLEGEATVSKAGDRPWRIDDRRWFANIAPFRPVYSDFYGNHQDWPGQTDYALAFRFGKEFPLMIPYVLFRYQGPHFVFRERESAHRLRTADETLSHGGLRRMGVGSYFRYGHFSINPEFEYMWAKNPVFGNSSDVRQDRFLSTFKKQDFLLSLAITYDMDKNFDFLP